MGTRRKAREAAMHCLYQAAIGRDWDIERFWDEAKLKGEIRDFAHTIVLAAKDHREDIDKRVEQYALHWRLDRIAAVDLAILRLAIAEMVYVGSAPAVVVIDEAVEIAKRYSTAESGAFVNGILDKIKKEELDKKG